MPLILYLTPTILWLLFKLCLLSPLWPIPIPASLGSSLKASVHTAPWLKVSPPRRWRLAHSHQSESLPACLPPLPSRPRLLSPAAHPGIRSREGYGLGPPQWPFQRCLELGEGVQRQESGGRPRKVGGRWSPGAAESSVPRPQLLSQGLPGGGRNTCSGSGAGACGWRAWQRHWQAVPASYLPPARGSSRLPWAEEATGHPLVPTVFPGWAGGGCRWGI